MSRKEVDEYLIKHPLYVRPALPTRERSSDTRWKTSTTNSRVQTFDAQTTPCSTTSATNTHVEETISVATGPRTPVSSMSGTRTRKTRQTLSRPSSSSSSESTQALVYSKPVSTYQPPTIVNKRDKFPRVYDQDRTRVVSGKHIPLTKATGGDLKVKNPIREEEAHSSVPVLLFRTYDSETHSLRHPAAEGEIAPYYATMTIDIPGPPPCHDDRLYATVANHINHVAFTGELLSTTSNLFFALRKAAKSNLNPRIKVIRGSRLPKKGVFYAWPWHERLVEDGSFVDGKWMNSTYHEYLVWAKIPQDAELCDFAFADLERHLIGNPSMQQVLRVDELRSGKCNTDLLTDFKRQNLELSVTMVEGIAKFLLHFGISVKTPGPIIARLVSETIRSFVIGLSKTVPQRWDSLAGAFAYALTANQPAITVSEKTLIKVKEAFKTGLASGLGDINWHLDPKKKETMLKRAMKRGLDVPIMLIDEVPAQQYQMESTDHVGGSQLIDLTADNEEDDSDEHYSIGDYEEHSEKQCDEHTDHQDDNHNSIIDEEEAEIDIEKTAQPRVQEQHSVNPASEHTHDHEPQEEQLPEDSEAETDIELAPQPSKPRLSRPNKYRLADIDDEDEIETDESNIHEPIQPEPRLSQRMPSPTPIDNRPRRRSNRRRTQTPPIYNFSRADGVDYIPDQSDDENYVDAEVDHDEMEF
jgi:hypothetical protein